MTTDNPVSFAEPYRLLTELQASLKPALSVLQNELLCEALERIRQLDWLLADVRRQLDKHVQLMETVSHLPHEAPTSTGPGTSSYRVVVPDQMDAQIESSRFLAKLHAEAFVYFAARLRKILKGRDLTLPQLQKFESPTIRDIRNHLLEHPEGAQSRIFNSSWMSSLATGVHLKALRKTGAPHAVEDPGLFVSAAELRDALTRTFKSALEDIAARETLEAGGARRLEDASFTNPPLPPLPLTPREPPSSESA